MVNQIINQDQAESQVLKKCSGCETKKSVSEFHRHKNKKGGLQYVCKACRAALDRLYYQNNKEAISAQREQFYKDNKTDIIARVKQYQQNHKPEKAAYNKQYQQDHKVGIAAYNKQYHQDNKEAVTIWRKQYQRKRKAERTIYLKEYRKENKEVIAIQRKRYRQTDKGRIGGVRRRHKRRALKVCVGYEVFNPQDIFKRDGYVCQLCGKKTRPDYKNPNHPLYPNLDHIVPLSKGGPHTKQNTQCLCHQCNMEKNAHGKGDQLRMFG